MTDNSAPEETDSSNISNNVLYLKDINELAPVQTMSSVTPGSSSVELAGAASKEVHNATVSSAAPGSSTAQLVGQVSQAQSNEAEMSSTPPVKGAGNPIDQERKDEAANINLKNHSYKNMNETENENEANFGVKPMPATAGLGNPLSLKPGEEVPDASTITENTAYNTVSLDRQAYLRSDAGPPQLEPVVTPETERQGKGGILGIGPVIDGMIPESSLPMKGGDTGVKDPTFHIQSASPQSTTAMLAGQVPREPRGVPEVVKESEKITEREIVTGASSDGVEDGKDVEKEIFSVMPVVASNVESKSEKAHSNDKDGQERSNAADGVPTIIKESIEQADGSPEATTNPEAVQKKTTVERELLKEVKPSDEAGEPAPSITSATSTTAPAPSQVRTDRFNKAKTIQEKAQNKEPAESQPGVMVVRETSGTSMAAAPVPVTEHKIPKVTTSDSRDISPMSKPLLKMTGTEPTASSIMSNETPNVADTHHQEQRVTNVTAGNNAAASAKTSAGSADKKCSSDNPDKISDGVAADRKSKRRSIFGRVKDKLKNF